LELAAVPCALLRRTDPPQHARPDGFRPGSARCRLTVAWSGQERLTW